MSTKTKTKMRPPAPSETPELPASLNLTATAHIDVQADAEGAVPALPRFQMVAYTGGPMRIARWRYPLVIDLAGMSIPAQSRPIRFGHDPLSGVGHTDSIRVEQGQLMAAGVVSRDTAAAREVVASSKNGFPWQASVGARVEKFEFIKSQQQVTVNGRQYTGPLNVVRKSTLGEISFVDLGADGQSSASVAASSAQESGETDVNDDETSTDGPATSTPRPVTNPPTAVSSGDTTVRDIRAEAAAEIERIAAVRRICAGGNSQIEAKAIREGWDAQRTELEVLRETRPTAPAVHVPDNTINGNVLEAACLLTAKASSAEDVYDPQTLDLASKRFRGGIGLQELLLEAAWANGFTGRNFRDSRGVLRFAFGQGIEAAGYSTIDVSGLLSNVANKFLLEGFFSVERTWRNICATRNVSDFKTVTSYRLIGTDQYEQVAPGGELKHGTLGNEQ